VHDAVEIVFAVFDFLDVGTREVPLNVGTGVGKTGSRAIRPPANNLLTFV